MKWRNRRLQINIALLVNHRLKERHLNTMRRFQCKTYKCEYDEVILNSITTNKAVLKLSRVCKWQMKRLFKRLTDTKVICKMSANSSCFMFLSLRRSSWNFNLIWTDLDMKITSRFMSFVNLTDLICVSVHCGVCVNCYTKLIYLWTWFSLFLSACSADDANIYQHWTPWFSFMDTWKEKWNFLRFVFG